MVFFLEIALIINIGYVHLFDPRTGENKKNFFFLKQKRWINNEVVRQSA
jgi:hypothetical protein